MPGGAHRVDTVGRPHAAPGGSQVRGRIAELAAAPVAHDDAALDQERMAEQIARPYLARRGQLRLPTWLVLVSMFGGIELIGGWGLLLGPLVLRLVKEALLIRSAARGEEVAGEVA
jgi:hypothetical protein